QSGSGSCLKVDPKGKARLCRAFDFRSALLTALLTGLVLPALLLTTLTKLWCPRYVRFTPGWHVRDVC
ncbi:MAG: hypothetical protein WBM31_06485, partial [Pseudolabrys sp.]